MNPCLVWQAGLVWISAVMWQVRERLWRGSSVVQPGDNLWRHMARSFGRDLVHGVAAWNPSTGSLAGALRSPDASCRFQCPSQKPSDGSGHGTGGWDLRGCAVSASVD